MERKFLPLLLSGMLLFLNALVMLGWLVENPVLVSFFPVHIQLVFNAACCFALAAMLMLLPDRAHSFLLLLRRVVGGIIVAICTLTLSQTIFHYDVGIDQWFVPATMDLFNVHPGRMGDCTALLLCMVGVVFASWPKQQQKYWMAFTRVTILLTVLIGILTLTGYWLRLEFLYHTQILLRVSLYSGIGFLLVGVALWSVSQKHMTLLPFHHYRDDGKILWMNGAILFFVALLGELSGFSVYSNQHEAMLKNLMQEALAKKVNVFNDRISLALREVNNIVRNTEFQTLLQSTQRSVDQFNLLFISRGFSAIAISDVNGKSIYTTGHLVAPTTTSIRLHLAAGADAELVWQNQWLVHIVKRLASHDATIGLLTADFPLDGTDLSLQHGLNLGQTGKILLCAHDANHVNCAARSRDENWQPIQYPIEKTQVSVYNALLGKRGESVEIDAQNNEVFTAYSPVGSAGLGVIVEIDTAELYEPVRGQLAIVVPIFLLSICLGMLLLSWQVSPLVRRIVVSEKKALSSNARLRESESRFRSAFDMSAIGMALVGLDGKWLRVNPCLLQIVNYSERDLLQMDLQQVMHAAEKELALIQLQQLVAGKVRSICMEQRFIKKGHQEVWVQINASLVQDENHDAMYFILQIQNIDKQKQAENLLREMAYHDGLTGLDNRAEIEKNINSAIVSASLSRVSFAVLFLDLDHFKEVNDKYGHDVGDALLKEVSARLRHSVRRSDPVGRLGGDEFVIVLKDIQDAKNISAIADKILQTVTDPFEIDDLRITVTTSVGVSIFPDDGISVDTLMKHADVALYCAKEFGKNNYQFFAGVGLRQ